jgi:hypothetical protein
LVSSEQFQNTLRGRGWNSNQDIIRGLYKAGKYQDAIQFAKRAYGINNVGDLDLLYDEAMDPTVRAGQIIVDKNEVVIKFGHRAFGLDAGLDHSLLQGDIFHEGVHVQQLLKDASATITDNVLEAAAYETTLKNAGYLHLSKAVKSYYAIRYIESTGKTKIFQSHFWYNIPRRNKWLIF